jgi:kumamolisin
MATNIELAGSNRPAPERGTIVGEVDPRQQLVVTVYLKDPAAEEHHAEVTESVSSRVLLSRRALARRRAREYAPAALAIAKFAAKHGLVVRRKSLARRCVLLRGTMKQIGAAFGTSLRLFDDGTQRFRVRSGPLLVSRDIAPFTRAVLGLDHRPQARHRAQSLAGAGAGPGLWPDEIARLYDIPADRDGAGQCVGVIALGGGYQLSDFNDIVRHMERPSPPVVADEPVGDASNSFGSDDRADEELALDLQVLYGVAPGAKIVVYFAESNTGSLVAALHQAVHDDKNRPQILTISWGSAERTWTDGARAAAQAALCDAKKLAVTVVAASGDNLATGGLVGKGANVFFPASSPYVLGCGGTSLTLDPAGTGVASESVWNETVAGTGGGISDFFPVPDYQTGIQLPPSVNDGGRRRGVPDVAGAAASTPGYRIVVNARPMSIDGTSAAAPLWAGLLALANAERGRPLGFVNPFLYANLSLFRAITTGDNRMGNIGYGAGSPWNGCTGLGVPKGYALVSAAAAMS